MELAFFADEVSKEDFEEAIRLGVEAGATGVELRGGIWGRRVQEIDDNEVNRVLRVLEKCQVPVLSVGSPFGKCSHENELEMSEHHEMFPRMIELAQTFGTPVIRGFGLWNPIRGDESAPRPDIEAYLDTVVGFLSPAVEAAEKAGVTLSLENEDATLVGTCSEAKKVANELGNSPGISFCWDVTNGIVCGEQAYPDGYAEIKGNITHLHVKPNREGELDPIDGSDLNYGELLKVMLKDGYEGAASIEHWDSPELMLKGVRALRRVIDAL